MIYDLINPDSTYYEDDGRIAIEELEKTATLSDQIGWCKGNIFKYEFRKNKKGQKLSDEIKIETFKNYLQLLSYCFCELRRDMICKEAYKLLGIEVDDKYFEIAKERYGLTKLLGLEDILIKDETHDNSRQKNIN